MPISVKSYVNNDHTYNSPIKLPLVQSSWFHLNFFNLLFFFFFLLYVDNLTHHSFLCLLNLWRSRSDQNPKLLAILNLEIFLLLRLDWPAPAACLLHVQLLLCLGCYPHLPLRAAEESSRLLLTLRYDRLLERKYQYLSAISIIFLQRDPDNNWKLYEHFTKTETVSGA